MLFVLTCAAGITLGLTCNVLVLIPVFFIGLGAFAMVSVASGYGFFDVLVASIIPMICLQSGYMVGLTGREMLANLFTRITAVQSKRV